MLSSAVPISKDDKRVSVSKNVKTARYGVNSGVVSSYVIDRQ